MSSNGQQRLSADDAEKLRKRCESCALMLGWKFPFFLPPVSRILFKPTLRLPSRTAGVDLQGNIYVDPSFAGRLSNEELQFVIAHEIMHLMLLHADRRGSRDPYKWNIVNDKLINHTLKKAADSAGSGTGIMTMPKEGLLATDAEAELTSEQLYADEPDPPENMQELFRNGMIGATAGCGASEEPGAGTGEDPSPPKQNTDGDGDGEPKSDSSLRRQWREVAAQAQLQSRDHGDLAGQILADLLDVPPPKVRWEQVLRGAVSRATTEAGVDDVSWSRRSRRSTPQIILPGGVTRKCRVAVVIDTSGSMSDDQLARCVSETTAIVNNTGIPIFLVVHDVEVHADCWIHPGNRGSVHKKINSKMIGRGGTDFDDAYNRVANERGRFSAMVHLTDGGVGEWPQRPSNVRRLVVALIATDAEHVTDLAPADARIIEVEL